MDLRTLLAFRNLVLFQTEEEKEVWPKNLILTMKNTKDA